MSQCSGLNFAYLHFLDVLDLLLDMFDLGCFNINAGHHFFTDTQSPGAEQADFIRVELPKTQQNRSDQFWLLLKNMVGLLPAWNYLLQNHVTLGSACPVPHWWSLWIPIMGSLSTWWSVWKRTHVYIYIYIFTYLYIHIYIYIITIYLGSLSIWFSAVEARVPFRPPTCGLTSRSPRTDGFDWVINLELDHFFFAPFLRQTIADHMNLMLQDGKPHAAVLKMKITRSGCLRIVYMKHGCSPGIIYPPKLFMWFGRKLVS